MARDRRFNYADFRMKFGVRCPANYHNQHLKGRLAPITLIPRYEG